MIYTRPDIYFIVSRLSQFMSNPNTLHELAMKHLLRYLQGSSKLRLCYQPTRSDKQEYVLVYSDSDYAADKEDRRSISGGTVMLGGGAVSWVSRKQSTIATSSTQAEYMALYRTGKNALWDRGYFSQLDRAHYIGKDSHSMTIYMDNQSAMKIAASLQISDRSKHFDIVYHAVREWVRLAWISLTYVATTDMIADGLTKPLEKQKHNKAVTMMGLIRMDEEELTT